MRREDFGAGLEGNLIERRLAHSRDQRRTVSEIEMPTKKTYTKIFAKLMPKNGVGGTCGGKSWGH